MNEKKRCAPTFTKSQLLGCAAFRGRRDVLAAVLEDGRRYTKGQARRLAENFLKGKVN